MGYPSTHTGREFKVCGSTAELLTGAAGLHFPGLTMAMATYRKKSDVHETTRENFPCRAVSGPQGQRVTTAGGSSPRSRGAPGGRAEAASCL